MLLHLLPTLTFHRCLPPRLPRCSLSPANSVLLSHTVPPAEKCLALSAWTVLSLGVALPLIVLHRMEQGARRRFKRSQPGQQQQQQQREQRLPATRRSAAYRLQSGQTIALMYSSSCCVWALIAGWMMTWL